MSASRATGLAESREESALGARPAGSPWPSCRRWRRRRQGPAPSGGAWPCPPTF